MFEVTLAGFHAPQNLPHRAFTGNAASNPDKRRMRRARVVQRRTA